MINPKTWNEALNSIFENAYARGFIDDSALSYFNHGEGRYFINNAVKERVIGKDDEPRNTLEHSRRNFLRREQRNTIDGDQS